MMKIKLFTVATIIALLFITGCTNKDAKQVKKEIKMCYVDGWAEGVAMTNLAEEILLEKGYKVNVKSAAVNLLFASMSNGDTDVFMDTWLPVTHKEKVARFADKLEYIGTNYTNAKIGLVVPSYSKFNSIEELNANAKQLDGKIIGIERGAGITVKTDEAMEQYGLKLKFLTSSSIAMLAELKKAISEHKDIVVTGWAPHWMFGRFDLKFLSDPKKVYGDAENIQTYARKGFKADFPKAAQFFANFSLDDEQMSKLLADMEEGSADKNAVAKAWIIANKALVDSWFPKEKKD